MNRHCLETLILALILPVVAAVGACEARVADRQTQLQDLARQSLSRIEGEIRLPGLTEEVDVIRDPWGIAHIYANNLHDLFFAQGFVAAQDRLWQIDVWRYYAQGRASEIVGPERFETDRLYRLMKYRGPRDEDFASYHPEADRIFTAFAEGINAYIEHRGDALPVEFRITGLRPEPWSADLSALRLIQRAARRAQAEVRLARDVVRLGAEEANRRHTLDPWVPLTVPEGLDVDAIAEHADEILQALDGNWDQILRPPLLPEYRDLARRPGNPPGGLAPGEVLRAGFVADGPAWTGANGVLSVPVPARRLATKRAGGSVETLLGRPVPGLPDEFRDEPGSNNWALSPSLTTTGGAIVANDPHRQVTNPSLRYLIHLNAPGWNVIGAGEPSLPGVAIGHNDRIAWGLTIVGTDQDDLYQEVVNPENPDQVRWRGGWEDLEVITDTIRIRGEEPRVVELKYGRHGPIVYEDTVNHYAYALKSVLHEPGTAHYLGSLRVDQAESCREFLEVMRYWKTPSENMICGDVDGNIAWQAAALTPDRGGRWHGRIPVPGTGEYEWRGFRGDLPEEYNPPRGWIATANHNIH
ncbi:MAG: penicillin acylase family protein, partial [Gemmatimonadetes bacterium]|nr:penicillin acylase family protein [Gemmatimonadota bacterium]NIR77430.1 penicillin acylase family protein [Gemmatimonadota bacterium]NIT85954.1 penicillin acylase family protein [Gemmatimonadota bacterium]NIU29774.1 penicillin acylase family protein [Gemmatimonadota bacterium]NIU34796.1 penicillin acylase family protein [Gemmatimonadota bacterium]